MTITEDLTPREVQDRCGDTCQPAMVQAERNGWAVIAQGVRIQFAGYQAGAEHYDPGTALYRLTF